MAKLKDQYAAKLLKHSEESGTLKKDLEQVVLLKSTLGDPQVQAFLADRGTLDLSKHRLFTEFFSERIPRHMMEFLYLTIREDQEALIIPVLTEYIDRASRYLGEMEAEVVSAKALTEKQAESICNVLSRKLHMPVTVKVTVDPELIGGFYVLANGHIFDGTVRTDLDNMKRTLKERKL